MSKPWDKIRVQPNSAPIGTGRWNVIGLTPYITVVSLSVGGDAYLSFGTGPQVGFSSVGLRLLAEFATELADQLDGK